MTYPGRSVSEFTYNGRRCTVIHVDTSDPRIDTIPSYYKWFVEILPRESRMHLEYYDVKASPINKHGTLSNSSWPHALGTYLVIGCNLQMSVEDRPINPLSDGAATSVCLELAEELGPME